MLATRGHKIDARTVRRILKRNGFDGDPDLSGPSWLSFIGNTLNGLWSVDLCLSFSVFQKIYVIMVVLDIFSRKSIGYAVRKYPVNGVDVCSMFEEIRRENQGVIPKHLSTDNDPLWLYHRWKANLNLLEIDEIKSVPFVPESHPFIERKVGITRQDFLHFTLFFGSTDLKKKLQIYQKYYNEGRVHSRIDYLTPKEKAAGKVAQSRLT